MLTTTTQIPSALSEYYDRNLLRRAVEENLHDMWAQVRPMKSATGDLIKFRRFGTDPASYELTEGTTPQGEQMTYTEVTATLKQYGNYIKVTDKLQFTSPDPVLTEAGKLLGEQMGRVRDKVVRDVMNAGSSVTYENNTGNGANRAAVSHPPVAVTLEVIAESLRDALARTIKEILKAGVGINTYPIAPCYAGLTHNRLVRKYRGLTDFIKVEEYSSHDGLMKREFGAIGDFRLVWGNETKVWLGAGAGNPQKDVYSTLLLGSDAYGVTALEKGVAKNIVKPLGSAGTADPLDQRATTGWKWFGTAEILNNDWIERYETTLAA